MRRRCGNAGSTLFRWVTLQVQVALIGTRPLGTERDGPTLATGRRSLLPLAPTCTRRTASSRCGAAACGSPCRVARGLRRSRPSVRWRGPTALSSGTKRGGTQHIARSSTLSAASPYIASPLHPRPSLARKQSRSRSLQPPASSLRRTLARTLTRSRTVPSAKRQPHAPLRRWATPERGCLFDSHDAYREHSESEDPTLPEALLLRPSAPDDATLLLSCSLLQRSCSLQSATEESSRDLACSLLQIFADSAVAGGAVAAVRVLVVSRCASLPFGAPRTRSRSPTTTRSQSQTQIQTRSRSRSQTRNPCRNSNPHQHPHPNQARPSPRICACVGAAGGAAGGEDPAGRRLEAQASMPIWRSISRRSSLRISRISASISRRISRWRWISRPISRPISRRISLMPISMQLARRISISRPIWRSYCGMGWACYPVLWTRPRWRR